MKTVFLALASVFLLLAGCAEQVPVVQKLAPLPAGGTCKIAVLPFFSLSSYPQGAAIVSTVFSSEMVASGHFQVAQAGDVRELYRQLLIYPNQLPSREQLKMIAGRLHADLLVRATIQKMAEKKGGIFTEPELTIIVHLFDGKSGRLLWVTYHHRRGGEYQQVMHVGRINTVTALARRMSREILTDWFKQGMAPCSE